MNVPPATATLLPWRADRDAALPPQACIEVVEAPAFVPVPGGPYYALGLMPWRGSRIPLLDLEVLLRAVPRPGPAQPPRWALVVAWPSPDGQGSAFGALALAGLPSPVTVDDVQACALPADSDLWPWIASACFRHGGQAVPVLDPARLFGTPHG